MSKIEPLKQNAQMIMKIKMKREDLLLVEIECNEVMTVSSNLASFSLLVAQSIVRASHYLITHSFVYFPIHIFPRFCLCSCMLH